MIRTRNIDPRTPARSANTRDQYLIRTPPTDLDGYCTSQAINTGVATTLNLDGILCINKTSRDSAGSISVIATAATLLYPSDLIFTLGAAVAVTGIVEGWDHMGNKVYFEFSKASAQTTFSLAQSTQVTILKNGDPARGAPGRSPYCCYSAIERIVLTNAGANSTVTVGWTNAGGNNFRMNRIPLPVLIDNAADICETTYLKSVADATVTTPAAVPAEIAHSTTVLGSGDLLTFATGTLVETVASVTSAPYEWIVTYSGGRNAQK